MHNRKRCTKNASHHSFTTTKSRINSCISLILKDGIRCKYLDEKEAGESATATSTIRLVSCSRSETCLATPSHKRSVSGRFSIVSSQQHRQVSRACNSRSDCRARDIAMCELKTTCWKAVDVERSEKGTLNRCLKIDVPHSIMCKQNTGSLEVSIEVSRSLFSQ
jgi:hypothetical protein